jgi:hypothetical protein
LQLTCGIFVTVCIFLNKVKVRDSFSVSMSPGYNNGGRHMHQSTLVVLMFLTLGQIFMLTCGVLILWLAGEFADTPKLRNDSRRTNQAGEATVAMARDTMSRESGERSIEHGDGLMTLADDHSIQPQVTDDHSIQPQATEDRADQLDDGVEHLRDRAVSAERLRKLG